MSSFATIVFSGGGVPALAFLGSVQYLEHLGAIDGVTTFVGSSAGAAIALMCALRMDAAAMRAWVLHQVTESAFNELDLDALLDTDVLGRLGLDDGSRLVAIVQRTLVHAGLPPDTTFLQLTKATGRNLVVCASNLTHRRREFMCVDRTPDLPVALAVRMSASVPMLFTPVQYKGSLYVDGGLLDNCPVDYMFEKGQGGRSGPPTTLALSADTFGKGQQGHHGMPSIIEYGAMLLHAALQLQPAHADADPILRVPIDVSEAGGLMCFSLRGLRFEVDAPAIDRLIRRGYITVRDNTRMCKLVAVCCDTETETETEIETATGGDAAIDQPRLTPNGPSPHSS